MAGNECKPLFLYLWKAGMQLYYLNSRLLHKAIYVQVKICTFSAYWAVIIEH